MRVHILSKGPCFYSHSLIRQVASTLSPKMNCMHRDVTWCHFARGLSIKTAESYYYPSSNLLVASNPSSHPPIILTHNFVFLFAYFHFGSSNCSFFFNFFETFLKSLRNFFWFLKICCFLLSFTNDQKKVASNLSFFFVARYLPVDPSIIQTNDILW